MDCAKAVSLAAGFDGDAWENFWARKGIIDFELLPVGVIPTTAGTGSECNGASVITNEEQKIKTGYDYPACNPKFARFAQNVWGISADGRDEYEQAEAGIDALENFIREIGLPATLRELGMKDKKQLREIAESCHYSPGGYRRLDSDEVLQIFEECF